MLRAVRGAGKDNPLAEIVAFTRLWRAFPRTSLQMSCCFLFPDCEVGFFWLKVGRFSSRRWEKRLGHIQSPLDSSCSGHQSLTPVSGRYNNLTFPADPLPPELERAAGVSCSFRANLADPGKHQEDLVSPDISSLVSYSSCHHQKPFIRGRCL